MTASTRTSDVRRNIVAAVVVFGAIGIGALVVVLATGGEKGPAAPTPTTIIGPDGSVVASPERPTSLPEANSGRAPEESGDPGGWEQTLIFALVVVAMFGIGVIVFRGSRRTRAAKDRWVAAAAPGQEDARRAEVERLHAHAAAGEPGDAGPDTR